MLPTQPAGSVHKGAHVEDKAADGQGHGRDEVVPRELRHSADATAGVKGTAWVGLRTHPEREREGGGAAVVRIEDDLEPTIYSNHRSRCVRRAAQQAAAEKR